MCFGAVIFFTMTFRQATTSDLLFIARGFHTAMLMNDVSDERIHSFAEHVCAAEGVLYSPENTIIAETDDGLPVGMLTSYDGAGYHEMRLRTTAIIKQHLGMEFPNMEDESEAGEYYLDSLAVLEEYRRQGIGRQLLEYGINKGLSKGLTVTLAVDPINEKAQHLYRSLGFQHQRDIFIFGHTYWKWARPTSRPHPNF